MTKSKYEIRRENADIAARAMFDHIKTDIDGVVQVGLGDWAEGPALLERFPDVPFCAFEPIERYREDAKRAGFPGHISSLVAWCTNGDTKIFGDRRSKTSIFSQSTSRGLQTIKAITVTLDEVLKDCEPSRNLLWLDCEGSEKFVLQGAAKFLKKVAAIIIELKDEPTAEWWTPTKELVEILGEAGFTMVYRHHGKKGDGDGVFLRTSELIT